MEKVNGCMEGFKAGCDVSVRAAPKKDEPKLFREIVEPKRKIIVVDWPHEENQSRSSEQE